MITRRLRGGSLSAFVLMFMMVVLVAVLGIAGLAANSLRRADRDKRAVVAFQAAQAGLEMQLADSFAELEDNNGHFVADEENRSTELAAIAPTAYGVSSVQLTGDARIAWITSSATYKGRSKSVRAYAVSRNVGIWNNAIFAGTGASGQAINGNVDVRGSVHILGDGEKFSDLNSNAQWDPAETYSDTNKNGFYDLGEPFNDANSDGVWSAAEPYHDSNMNGQYDPPLTQTDLNSSFSGTAYIGNNYSGMPLALEQMVPNAPRINGIEQLGAEVRVKHGRISIQGNAEIGTGDVIDGGTSKSTIDGSYVSDGYTGSAGASHVFSDNGTSNSYDLGNLGISFPYISGIGAQNYVKSGQQWATQENYLDDRSLTIPVNTITASTPAFSYGPDAYGNSITYVPEIKEGSKIVQAAKITINGIIKVNGTLTIGPGNGTIGYAGNGTFYATQNIDLRTNILPAAGTIFPTSSRIGYIAKQNMNIATGSGDSQLSLAGAFFAQGKIVSAKQNQIAGTFVANFFDLGTNVPNIYQVPELVNNMPPAMPGDKNYFTMKVTGWRERQ